MARFGANGRVITPGIGIVPVRPPRSCLAPFCWPPAFRVRDRCCATGFCRSCCIPARPKSGFAGCRLDWTN
jgi:hypothetical protein